MFSRHIVYFLTDRSFIPTNHIRAFLTYIKGLIHMKFNMTLTIGLDVTHWWWQLSGNYPELYCNCRNHL